MYIVREDLLNHELPITPAILSWKDNSAANSLYNTPPTFVYVFEVYLDIFEIMTEKKLNLQHLRGGQSIRLD